MKINKNKVKVVSLYLLSLVILTLIAVSVYLSSSKEEKSQEDKQNELSMLLENSHQKDYREMKKEQQKVSYKKYEKELAEKRERKRQEELARKREERRIYLEKVKLARENELKKQREQVKQQREKVRKQVASGNNNDGNVGVSRSSGYQSNYEITHYTAFCPTGCQGKTATGHDVSNTIYYQGYRIVAAPPNVPFNTKLKITYSNGTVVKAIVLDRGGAIQGKKILDLLVSNREEAYRLGRQQVKVEILN